MNTENLVRQWFDTVWNQKNPGAIAELMDASAVGVSEGGEIHGPEQFKSIVYDSFVRALPDVKVSVDRVITDGDAAAVRWTVTGTQSGPLGDIPPSGKTVRFSGMSWVEFANGKIVRGADSYNLHGLLAYLSGGPETATVRAVD